MPQSKKVPLSPSEIDHLLFLLRKSEQDKTYYGSRAAYENRQKRLIEKLEANAGA